MSVGVLCTFKKLPILGQFFWNLGQITSPIVKEILELLLEHKIEMGLEWRPVEGNPRAPVPTEMFGRHTCDHPLHEHI